jgi:hypothetical protein
MKGAGEGTATFAVPENGKWCALSTPDVLNAHHFGQNGGQTFTAEPLPPNLYRQATLAVGEPAPAHPDPRPALANSQPEPTHFENA